MPNEAKISEAKTWQRVYLFLMHGLKDNVAKMKEKQLEK